jgi:predicted DNA-binding transcriptional regulator AlpA
MEAPATIEPAVLNEDGMAEFLGGVSKKHLYNLRLNERLPFTMVGSRVMYPITEVREWLAARTQQIPAK